MSAQLYCPRMPTLAIGRDVHCSAINGATAMQTARSSVYSFCSLRTGRVNTVSKTAYGEQTFWVRTWAASQRTCPILIGREACDMIEIMGDIHSRIGEGCLDDHPKNSILTALDVAHLYQGATWGTLRYRIYIELRRHQPVSKT